MDDVELWANLRAKIGSCNLQTRSQESLHEGDKLEERGNSGKGAKCSPLQSTKLIFGSLHGQQEFVSGLYKMVLESGSGRAVPVTKCQSIQVNNTITRVIEPLGGIWFAGFRDVRNRKSLNSNISKV